VTGGTGAAVPAKTTSYSSSSGLVTSVAAAATAEVAASTVTYAYDDFGRLVSYDDGTGATATTTTYDGAGRVQKVTDAKGDRTFSYDGGGERRGLPTSVAVSGVGTFTASYGADGGLASQTWPNGVTQTLTRDQAGRTVRTRVAHGTTVWLDETVAASAHGQWRSRASTIGAASGSQGGAWTYGYDAVGRLTQVTDDPSGATGCTTRTYALDANSSRVAATTYAPGTGGACQSTTGSAVAHRYDTADRLLAAGIDAGLAYDAFGRVTTLPGRATDTPTGAAVTAAYFANDLVRSLSRGTATQRWTLDAAGRLATRTDLTGGTETGRVVNHYADGSDSPAWIAENAAGTAWTRNVRGLDGALVATVDQSGTVSWKVTNLHGDVVATSVGTATAPATGYAAEEFGTPQGATPGRYGWLGAHHRAADVLGGLTLMGVRLYAPVLGRFLQVDPIPGGNDNAYVYPSDPINAFDLDGRWSWKSVGDTVGGWGKTVWNHRQEILLVGGMAAAGACIVATAGVCGAAVIAVGVTTSAVNGIDLGYKMAKGTAKPSDFGFAALDAVLGGTGLSGAAKSAVRYRYTYKATGKITNFRSFETAIKTSGGRERLGGIYLEAARDGALYGLQQAWHSNWW
jgi:RHS repeat-associated protein